MVFRLGIFLVLIVALIVVSVFGLSILNHSKQQAAAPPPTAQILIATTTMDGGSLLQPSDMADATVLANAVPVGASLDTPDNRAALVGAMARVSIPSGAPILNSAVIHPGDHGFLAAVLAPGMRAVTVGVDAISGANGLIWPGDNVDVLLTQTIPGAPGAKSIAAEVVLSDVRVIATGQEVVKNATPGPTPQPPAQTVTLEVTPDQAARCLVASDLGKLSLIVHSAQAQVGSLPPQDLPPEQPIWAGQVSPALANTQPASPRISTVHVFQGSPAEQDYSF
ncbi:Flp pilus assembly protein CpaB [Acidocella sp.]|jgi:pilus assembly protein CpaB|uniref:Flp pilus assembly protein CpaB n=1 Tax=Acidocella sp. TaxID=50710 RepID=UPI002F408BB4